MKFSDAFINGYTGIFTQPKKGKSYLDGGYATDRERISGDWQNVGRYISGAVGKYKGQQTAYRYR